MGGEEIVSNMRLWLAKINVVVDKHTRIMAFTMSFLTFVVGILMFIWARDNLSEGLQFVWFASLVGLFAVSFIGAVRDDRELGSKYYLLERIAEMGATELRMSAAATRTAARRAEEHWKVVAGCEERLKQKKEKMLSLVMWGGNNGKD